MTNVVIIDDEPLSREIVKAYLKNFPDMEIVQECGDGFEGVKAIQEHKPDLIFLDIQMPKITGFEMLELIDHKPSAFQDSYFKMEKSVGPVAPRTYGTCTQHHVIHIDATSPHCGKNGK